MSQLKVVVNDPRRFGQLIADQAVSVELVEADSDELAEWLAEEEQETSTTNRENILRIVRLIVGTGSFILETFRESRDTEDMKKDYTEEDIEKIRKEAVEEAFRILDEKAGAKSLGLSLDEYRKLMKKSDKEGLEEQVKSDHDRRMKKLGKKPFDQAYRDKLHKDIRKSLGR